MRTLEKKATYKSNVQDYKFYSNSNKANFPISLNLSMYLDSIRLTL